MYKEYYYLDSNEQKGPLGIEQLKSVGLKPDSKVWNEGLDNWIHAKDVEELKILFDNMASPAKPLEQVKFLKLHLIILFTNILDPNFP